MGDDRERLPRLKPRNDDVARNGERKGRLPRRLCLLAMTGWRDCRACHG
ncbi:MAG: hypothetical protein PHQ93_01740 [Sulfurimonas sp.]|nr:hypothetical protein [Sulfurimonas sp.]MDD5399897.1 hypothetical protein [Sulfurimonas sp.]